MTKINCFILIVAIAVTTFARADLSRANKGLIRMDAVRALNLKTPLSEADSEVCEAAISEATALIRFTPGALAELNALTDNEPSGPISAILLQEVINDFESMTEGKRVPALISSYIARSKVEVLSPRQRALCYLMIKSSIRQINPSQK